ncbi:MAG: PDZ domain-containing protein [Deltaproteobacteria bacterium]|nr:PDZ domain-containing protein [Deltaproteobacteria bacterium]
MVPSAQCPDAVSRGKVLPSWLVALVVLGTAGVTAGAMVHAGYWLPRPAGRPYGLAGAPPLSLPWLGMVGRAEPGAVWANAVRPFEAAVPGAIPAHGDRGACSGCHSVVGADGAPLPPIGASSPLPHSYRGVCGNCHRLVVGGGSPNAAGAGRPAPPLVPAPAPSPAEGEWLGMEISPIAAMTARQFGIDAGTAGLVVVEAEGPAAAAGLRPGDVLMSVNGAAIVSMADLFQATRNGSLGTATLELLRGGARYAVVLSAAAGTAPFREPAAAPAGTMGSAPTLQVRP